MFLCICKAVKVSEAVDAARDGIDSPALIRQFFGFDDAECCGRCADQIDAVADVVLVELRKADRVVYPAPALVRA